MDISERESEQMMKRLARDEGIFAGVSSGGATAAALKLSTEVKGAMIMAIICDRGDRYLSTGILPRPIDGGAGPSGSICLARLDPLLQEVLKIYDR